MLNLRKLKQDLPSSVLRDGKALYEEKKVLTSKILHLNNESMRIVAKILGQYENKYEVEVEIDRQECELIDSNCDCPHRLDCQHLAALLFHLDTALDTLLVDFSKETDLEDLKEDGGQALLEAVQEATTKEEKRRGEEYQKELLDEYIHAQKFLCTSPFFSPELDQKLELAELVLCFSLEKAPTKVGMQIALRVASRSKPVFVPNVALFFESLSHNEPIFLGGKRHLFGLDSFNRVEREIVKFVMDHALFLEKNLEKVQKTFFLPRNKFADVLAKAYGLVLQELEMGELYKTGDPLVLPALYEGGIEKPMRFSKTPAKICIDLEYLEPPTSKFLFNPMLIIGEKKVRLEEVHFLLCQNSGLIYNHVYYRFAPQITHRHLQQLHALREVTIPEPCFGTFVENSFPQLLRFAAVSNQKALKNLVTLPYAGEVKGVCKLSFVDGEIDAKLFFQYDQHLIPAAPKEFTYEDMQKFVGKEGIMARNLVDEQAIVDALFSDFMYDNEGGCWVAKSEKKIIEFMTEIIPKMQSVVTFDCPQNLLEQFIYDETQFSLKLSHQDRMDVYEIAMEVDGALANIKMDQLWDCIASKRPYLELDQNISQRDKGKSVKILVLDLEKIVPLVQLFDELGIEVLSNHILPRPLWSLANIEASYFAGLNVAFSMTKRLQEIRLQMLGEKALQFSPIPQKMDTQLRSYQREGVQWLERLRRMYLNGILADDMGLGKTLQAITAISQAKADKPSLIVCPTSLLYNWQEECHRFDPDLRVVVVDGMPQQRKQLIQSVASYDVVITSYTLLQKDVEIYQPLLFFYMILDEAQHIKNRSTRNARSVKVVPADHRLILSGTPIENSLDELWSLFDFLMPGFLNTYDRFTDKYVRASKLQSDNLLYLKKKIAPFVLRRMKADVLDDLPPVSEITYRCQLSKSQKELYHSYAKEARNELVKLVEADGFDKVQIHVLATLTRLKQICCHPAIFAKESAEVGDSAKYDLLCELLQTLSDGGHKTVIFSQYTRMLQIMKQDLERQNINFLYLDGSSKNRLQLVKQFNEDHRISVFLVSLKAGGTGLNLVGADTVIHYDMWWNPAVENQATDRVHRLGQKQSVSVYKLVTLKTIEEKILEMQNRKRGIVKKLVSCDDEALSKLTWEDVLELLQP